MKLNIKSFICGMLVMGVISSAVVIAADNWQTINVLPNTIKVVVDGKEVQADNFLYNNTTYLPIRAVSEALGKDVQYDNATSTATISEKKEVDNVQVTSKYTPPADVINDTERIILEDGIYYVTVKYIEDFNVLMDYNENTGNLDIVDKNGEKHSLVPTYIKDRVGFPYDQFVEEIEPLLK